MVRSPGMTDKNLGRAFWYALVMPRFGRTPDFLNWLKEDLLKRSVFFPASVNK